MKKAKKADAGASPEANVVSPAQPEADAVEVVVAEPAPAAEGFEDDDAAEASADDEDEAASAAPRRRDPEADSTLTVRLSAALVSKLRYSAQDEGISVDMLVSELLAEGVALRAWEIIERKGAMRGVAPSGGPQQGNGNNRYGNGNRHDGGGHHGSARGGGNNRYGNANGNANSHGGGNRYNGPGKGRPNSYQGGGNAWMEDKAAFLEYVRNQEKRRR